MTMGCMKKNVVLLLGALGTVSVGGLVSQEDRISAPQSTDGLAVKTFERMDMDHNGHIDIHELSAMLHEYGMAEGVGKERLNKVFEVADVDNDGIISAGELENQLFKTAEVKPGKRRAKALKRLKKKVAKLRKKKADIENELSDVDEL
jgi:hypothetical protein